LDLLAPSELQIVEPFVGDRRGHDRAAAKVDSNMGRRGAAVQDVHVAEGGQAIVGNVSTPTPGVGVHEKLKEQPHALAYAPGVEMPRQIEAERATLPRACRAGA